MLPNSVPRFRARYAAGPSCVGVIRGEVKAVARELGIEGEQLGDVALAVSEAATNAVVHAYAEAEGELSVTAAMHTTAMSATNRAYSTSEAPRSVSPKRARRYVASV